MTYLAVWLLALGAGDLARPGAELGGRRPSWLPVLVSVPVAVLSWPLLGQRGGWHLLALLGIVLLLVVWARSSAAAVSSGLRARDHGAGESDGDDRAHDPSAAAAALLRSAGRHRLVAGASLLVGLVALFALAGVDAAAGGPLARWWGSLGLPRLGRVPLDRALMVLAVMLAQIGTGNVVVRLVLDAAGAHSQPGVLRGGRWLGPMERVFVVGLALAGQATAASVVIAAKGILRFPELQDQRGPGQRIDVVTEYFLLGSFTSWLVALGCALLAL